ncbi:hypothetical protein ABZW18_00875 [Streptomyces sp. NPDC004647]|uniref:hypothetical protein n=1 Tax=Streptomyces sp. NPDC004647 TaxID=3154671 RepID=UPI0033B5C96D
MSARTHSWTAPPARNSYEVRLPWWAIALPSIAFAALLLLLVGPSDAHAVTGSEPGVFRVLEQIQTVLLHSGR